MDSLYYFYKACLIGFAIAAPLGPIGILCIKKTIEIGFVGAMLVGVGTALGDVVFASIAAFGISNISTFLENHANIIKIIGGFLLLYLAYKELKNNNDIKEKTTKSNNYIQIILEVFVLTIINPLTIISFIAVFASISVGRPNISDSFAIISGIFLGSMIWWTILGGIVVKIKNSIPKKWMNNIKYISMAIIGSFGLFSIFNGACG